MWLCVSTPWSKGVETGRQIPEAHPASLAESVSSRFSKRFCTKKQGREKSRCCLVWPPPVPAMAPEHAYTCMQKLKDKERGISWCFSHIQLCAEIRKKKKNTSARLVDEYSASPVELVLTSHPFPKEEGKTSSGLGCLVQYSKRLRWTLSVTLIPWPPAGKLGLIAGFQ